FVVPSPRQARGTKNLIPQFLLENLLVNYAAPITNNNSCTANALLRCFSGGFSIESCSQITCVKCVARSGCVDNIMHRRNGYSDFFIVGNDDRITSAAF